jgi:hypothetical protein
MVFGNQETPIVQDCPGPILVPQVVPTEKAAPLTVMPSMMRLVFRLFVRRIDS